MVVFILYIYIINMVKKDYFLKEHNKVYKSMVDFDNLVYELETTKNIKLFKNISNEYNNKMEWNDILIMNYYDMCKCILNYFKKERKGIMINNLIDDFINIDYYVIKKQYLEELEILDNCIYK